MIPDNMVEIPTLAAAASHHHLKPIDHEIPSLENAEILLLLLLGRNLQRVHKACRQISGTHEAAFAQKLDLGWVIISDMCLGTTRWPSQVTSMKAYTLESGRQVIFPSVKATCQSRKSPYPLGNTCLSAAVFVRIT